MRISHRDIVNAEEIIKRAIMKILIDKAPFIMFSNPKLYSKCYLPPYSRNPEINSAIRIQRWVRKLHTISKAKLIYKKIDKISQERDAYIAELNQFAIKHPYDSDTWSGICEKLNLIGQYINYVKIAYAYIR
mgnify:CR=1 FL=1